jgi:ABC-2 type transport system ATP-binding protein
MICSFENVSKAYRSDFLLRKNDVLKSISFDVHAGETLAYLGHNGAGKTTSIKALLGLIKPDSGKVTLFGKAAGDRAALSRIGYVPENPYFYDHLTGTEFLQLICDLHSIEKKEAKRRIGGVLELVGMTDRASRRMRGYSKGMLQRMALGQALLNDPEFLILDEPMGGLDPMGRKQIRNIICELRSRRKSILISSHILADIEAVAYQIISTNQNFKVFVADLSQLEKAISDVQSSGAHFEQVQPRRMSLEEVFLNEYASDRDISQDKPTPSINNEDQVARLLAKLHPEESVASPQEVSS